VGAKVFLQPSGSIKSLGAAFKGAEMGLEIRWIFGRGGGDRCCGCFVVIVIVVTRILLLF
jgi:hypothetical protein